MLDAHPIGPGAGSDSAPQWVWYTAYGSNTHLDRLAYYIKGGRLPGTDAVYPGCRDRRMPSRSVPVELDGALYFATESPVWGGGRAFYDRHAEGRVHARAHLLPAAQFADIAAQEMGRSPGADLDLSEVLTSGVAELGSGRYETLVCAGQMEGLPVLTFTAPWGADEVTPVAPSRAYVRFIASGLLAAGAWDVDTVAAYVASARGAAGHWTERAVRALISQ
ncbi:histone deacetylase [Streptomyces sp. NBC_00859]|uniref:histone deacetylase n=1 Tax=Streptomyces sp. NBC_00859 TaxID=2903682 RepID=UPI00386E6FF6|nr:histone deacetylase [Streptomyces sp. NBC_00859]